MRRGTTPTYVFKIPPEFSEISKAKITFTQNGSVVLEKYLKDCTFEENKISVQLTQEDTFLFSHNHRCEIQLRIQLPDNTTLASSVYNIVVEECLDAEVL